MTAPTLAPAENAAARLLDECRAAGADRFLGVPCSTLKRVFACLDGDAAFLPMPREDVAVGVAGGLMVGGGKPVLLMQNSGLGYCLNALTSFIQVYDMPLHLIVGWRGGLERDAVEHWVMGPATVPLFELLGARPSVYGADHPEPFGSFTERLRRNEPGLNALLVGGGL